MPYTPPPGFGSFDYKPTDDTAPKESSSLSEAFRDFDYQSASAGNTAMTRVAVDEALSKNPDEEAERRKLAGELGVPAAVVPSVADARNEVNRNKVAAALADAPKTSAWLQDKAKADIASDDIEHLATIESDSLFRRTPAVTTKQFLQGVITDFKEQMVSSVSSLHSFRLQNEKDHLLYSSGLWKAQQDYAPGSPELEAAQAKYDALAAEIDQKLATAKDIRAGTEIARQAAAPEFESDVAGMFYRGISGGLRSGAMALTAWVPGVGPGLMMSVMGTTTATEAQMKYADRGATYKEAVVGAGLETLFELGTEAIPLSVFMRKAGGETEFGKFLVELLGKEIPGEMVNFIGQSAVDTAIANPDKTWGQWVSELPAGLAETVIATTIGTTMMAAPQAAVRKMGRNIEDIEKANRDQATLDKMNDMAANSKLRGRSAEDFRDFIESIQEEGGASDVYVSAKAMQELLASEAGSELVNALPDIATQMANLSSPDSDIKIPISHYLSTIAGTPVAELLQPHVKLDPDGITFAQSEVARASLADDMRALAEEMATAKVLTREEFEAQQAQEVQAAQEAEVAPVKDRRAYTATGERVDRRVDKARRKTIEEGLAEIPETDIKAREAYLTKQALTDPLTGLLTRRAWDDYTQGTHKAFLDVDALGWTNDHMGHQAGDALLRAVADAISQVGGAAYRYGGDEVTMHGNDPAELKAIIDLANDLLKDAVVEAELPDGTIVTRKGLQVSYGIAETIEDADKELYRHKGERQAAGLRAEKGKQPPGVVRQTAEGDEVAGPVPKLKDLIARQQEAAGQAQRAEAVTQAPKQTYEEYLAQHSNKDAVRELDKAQVRDTLVEEFKKTQRFNSEVMETYVVPLVDWYDNMSARMGITPSEMYKLYPLKIRDSAVGETYAQDGETVSDLTEEGFYSALARGVAGLKPTKAMPQEWRNLITKLPGVKLAEIEATGVLDAIEAASGGKSVSKDYIVEFLNKNGIELEVKILSTELQNANERAIEIEMDNLRQEMIDNEREEIEQSAYDSFSGYYVEEDEGTRYAVFNDAGEQVSALFVDEQDALDVLNEMAPSPDQMELDIGEPRPPYFIERTTETEYVVYDPSGREESRHDNEYDARSEADDYNDSAIAEYIDEQVRDFENDIDEESLREQAIENIGIDAGDIARFEQYTETGGSDYREILIKVPRNPLSVRDFTYISHFGSEANIVAHMRVKTRQTEDGKNILFVEEFQSDWGQQGRDRGFAKKHALATEDDLVLKEVKYDEVDGRKFWDIEDKNGDFVTRVPGSFDRDHAVLEGITQLNMLRNRTTKGVPRGPFVEDTKLWLSLLVKRALKLAADEQLDGIAWTTGSQQNRRYSLSRHVDRIAFYPDKNFFRAYDFNGNPRVDKVLAEGETLADYIGKDAAEKLMATAPITTSDGALHELSTGGLEVGGKGMTSFYDHLVPSVVNDTAKKLKGGKVQKLDIPRLGAQQGLLFNDEMRANIDKGFPLFQGDRGTFNPSTLTISLLRGADLSTFNHEAAHFYLEVMADVALRDDAPKSIKDDFNKVLNWFGLTADQWKAMDLEAKREYHEQWAESYERWLLEGKAPTVDVQPIFSRFRAWMMSVYKSVENFLKKHPRAGKLNDEIREVYQRLHASEEAIAQSEALRSYEPIFKTADEVGNEKLFNEYMELHREATQDATDELAKRSMRDMKWLSNAKSEALKELQAEAKRARKKVRAEVTEEVMAKPVNQLRRALHGKAAPYKLATLEVKDMLPDLDISLLRGLTSTENGTHPDQLADMFGYRSGIEMINDLLDAEKANVEIDAMTDLRMLEEHGELIDPDAIEHAANLAVHNEARARFMATGLKILTKSQLPASQLAKAAKEAAELAIARKKIRDIKPRQYEAEETRANRDLLKLAPKDPIGAAAKQRAALLNNRLVRAATDALAEVDNGVERMKKLGKAAAQSKMRGDYLEQLNALLDRFDLRTSVSLRKIDEAKKPLAEWLKETANELSAIEPDVPAFMLNEGFRKHYKDLTMEEFRGVMDTVKALELLARREEKQYQAIRDMSFKEERKNIIDRMRQFHAKAFDAQGEPYEVPDENIRNIKKLVRELGGKAVSELVNAETLLNILEGGQWGQVSESLFGRISKSIDNKSSEMENLFNEMAGYFKQYTWKERSQFSSKQWTTINGTPVSRENVIMVALLHGSLDGRQRLRDSYGWSDEAQLQAINTLADKDFDFIEGIWKMFDKTLWPRLKDLNERTRGKAPPKIPAAGYEVRGRKLTGGYFRLKYKDIGKKKLSEQAQSALDLQNMFGGNLGMSVKTSQSSSTERKENVKLKPRLDLGVFSETVSETVHDLHLREAVADTIRLLNDKGIANAITNIIGEHNYNAIVKRVTDVAMMPRDPQGFIEKAATLARNNTVATLMSGLGTAMQNITGLVPALSRVNPVYALKEISTYWYRPSVTEEVHTLSQYMKHRHNEFDRALLNEAKKLGKAPSIKPEMSTLLWFMGQTDKLVSIPVWRAAFKEGLTKFDNDKTRAVDYADNIVRQTQGAGRVTDVSDVMTGGPLRKLFTMFYSYFNAQLGMLVRSGAVNAQLAKTNPALATALFTKDFLLIVAIPAILTRLVFSAPSDDDEDKSFARLSGEAMGQYVLGMFPLIRDAGALLWSYYDPEMKGFGYKITPAQSAVEGVVKAPGAIYDIATGEGTTQDVKNAIMGVSYAIGLPGKLIANTVTGTDAFLSGEAGPEALIYGAPYKKE